MQKQLLLGNRILQYSSSGQGPSVVLVHGFGEDSRIWLRQKEILEQQYHVLLPDLPGSGNAALPGDTVLTMESMASDLKALLDAEQIRECVMLGHSMGGYITLAFAELYPSCLKGFGLVHSTALPDSEEKKEARRKSIQFIQHNGAGEFIKATLPNLFSLQFREKEPDQVAQLIEWGQWFTSEALIAYYEAMMARPDRTHVLKNAAVPVLHFIGGLDQAVTPKDALEQAALPAVCQVHFIPTIAHMGMWEAPDELNQQLLNFLQLTNDPLG
jgi:pimeloyl-ACP methyl ester carboxylesterase